MKSPNASVGMKTGNLAQATCSRKNSFEMVERLKIDLTYVSAFSVSNALYTFLFDKAASKDSGAGWTDHPGPTSNHSILLRFKSRRKPALTFRR